MTTPSFGQPASGLEASAIYYDDQRSLYNRCSEYTVFIEQYGELEPYDFMTVAKHEQSEQAKELASNPDTPEPDMDTKLLRKLRDATVKFLERHTPPELDYCEDMKEFMEQYYYGFYSSEKNIAQAFFNYCCEEYYCIDWDNIEQFGILSFIPNCMDWEQVARQFSIYGVYDLIDQHAFNTDW